MHRHHWKVKKEGRRTLPPATLLHIEKTQWSPNCRIKTQGQGRSGQTFAGTRSSTLRPWVLSLTLTCLATLAQASASFSKGRLCRVRRRFPGSEALRCKGSGIYANCGQLCLPFPGWAVFALGTEFMLRGIWGDKARLFEDRGHPWEAHYLAVLWKECAAVLVKFG